MAARTLYDIYDLMEAVNQRRMLQQQQQQQQQQQRRRTQMVQPQRRQQEQPVYFAQARPSAGRRGYGQRQSSYASPFAGYSPWYVPEYEDEDGEDDDSKVYTLEDILNLVNRHRHRSLQSERLDASELAQKRRQAEQELAAKKQAQECAEEAAAVAQLKEQQEEAEKKLKAAQDEEDSVMTDAEGPQPQVFDIADFIRQALLAGSEEEEEEEEASRPASPVTPTETVASEAHEAESVTAKKPEITKKPSSASVKKTPTKVSSFHMPAPSPIHDPLQVSHPEMDRGLPFSPNVDVYDKPSQYKVVLALPGASKDSFEIDFHPTNHELVIRGSTDTKNKMVSSSNDAEVDYLKVSEIRFGAFERSIKFPILPKINDEAIGAKYSNGLLEVCVPKVAEKEAAKPKKRVTVEEVEDEELKFEEGMKKL